MIPLNLDRMRVWGRESTAAPVLVHSFCKEGSNPKFTPQRLTQLRAARQNQECGWCYWMMYICEVVDMVLELVGTNGMVIGKR